jgi:hypothetical protein
MNRLPGLNCQLNTVDSSPLTLMHRAPRSTADRAFVRSNWWSKVTVALIVWLSCALVEVRPAGAQERRMFPPGLSSSQVDLWPQVLDIPGVGAHSCLKARSTR